MWQADPIETTQGSWLVLDSDRRDEAALELKEILKLLLQEKGHEVEDFGTFDTKPVLYPDIAFAAAQSIVDGVTSEVCCYAERG